MNLPGLPPMLETLELRDSCRKSRGMSESAESTAFFAAALPRRRSKEYAVASDVGMRILHESDILNFPSRRFPAGHFCADSRLVPREGRKRAWIDAKR